MHGAALAPPHRQLAAFATSQFIAHGDGILKGRLCLGGARCAVLQWLRQTQATAGLMAELSGQVTSVHIFTECVPPEVGSLLSRTGGAPVTVHPRHSLQLRQALRVLRQRQKATGCCPQWDARNSPKFRTLLKWQFVSEFTGARLVIVLDLDVEINPNMIQRAGCAGAHRARDEQAARVLAASWLAVVQCGLAGNGSMPSLLAWADHSSPVNAGFMLIRPSSELFKEGLRVLRRARFNSSHGWDYVGPPFEAVDESDDAWRVAPGLLEFLNADSWSGFVHGSLDQGLFFYVFRVLHRLGNDLALTDCASRVARAVRGGVVKIHHYVTGCKPESCLGEPKCYKGRPAPQLAPKFLRALRGAGRFRKRRTYAGFVARTLSWANRTAADLAQLRVAVSSSSRSTVVWREPVTELAACEAVLRDGLSCTMAWLDELRVAPCAQGRFAPCLPAADAGEISARELVDSVFPRAPQDAIPTQTLRAAGRPNYQQTRLESANVSAKARWQAWRVARSV